MNQKLDLDFYGENCKNIVKLFLEQKKTECDVCLMGCDGTIIKSHKIILSACSSYFNCVLSKFQNNQEKDLVLLMPAYTEKEIRGVLNFIYNGKLPENDKDDRPSYDRLISIANELKVVGMAQSIELLSKLIPKMLDVKEFEKQLMEKESDKSSSIEISKYDEANRKAAKVLKSTKDFPGWMMRFKSQLTIIKN
uniref:CSON014701 protein n=1 Tax=Culicoides sonorensis TaxID=179676 RepID=A0A336MFE2_CULSO